MSIPPEIIAPITSAWSLVGAFLYHELTDEFPHAAVVDESTMTTPQLIFLRLLCGPLIWVYGFWRLLGMWGK